MVKVEEKNGFSVVKVEGEVDLFNSQDLKSDVENLINSGKVKLILDMTKVSYIDSSGLGILVGINKRARMRGGFLRLAALPPDIKHLFEMTKLDKIFDIYPTVERATT